MKARYLLALLVPMFAAALAWAQSVGRPTRVGASSGPMWSRGFATDGGVTSASVQSDTATVGSLDAGSVRADSASFGAVDAGSLYAQSARFGTRPLGIFLPGDYARTTGLALTTLGGWTSAGTLTIPGVLVGDACNLVSWPAGLNILSVDYRCAVTGANTAEIQFKALVALTIPTGTYKVLISGPGQ